MSFGLRPSAGTPEYNLMLDVGICLDPVKFNNLIEAKTALAGKTAAQNMQKNNPSSVTTKEKQQRSCGLACYAKMIYRLKQYFTSFYMLLQDYTTPYLSLKCSSRVHPQNL